MGSCSVDEIESDAHPACRRVTNANNYTVHAHKQTSDLWWDDFALVERYESDECAYTPAGDEAGDSEHGVGYGTRLQGTAYYSDDGVDEQSLAAAVLIGGEDAGECPYEAAALKQAIKGADELVGIWTGVELEVGEERGLAERCCDNASGVACPNAKYIQHASQNAAIFVVMSQKWVYSPYVKDPKVAKSTTEA